MSTTTQERTRPLLPPDERFWQRYSPHHEFPLASMTSLFLHGLAIGFLILAGYWYMFQRESESAKPPSIDVVQVAGGGDGFEGAGAEPGLPGEARTEITPAPSAKIDTIPDKDTNLKAAPNLEFSIPEPSIAEPKTDVDAILSDVGKEAADQAKKEPAPAVKQQKIAMPGTGNSKGQGGQGGTGGGPGKGMKGTGTGIGGPGGRAATKAEVYARRWRFELAGQGKDHAEKLIAIGVTIAIPLPTNEYLFIDDLRRRPVSMSKGSMEKFKDAVRWEDKDPGSLHNLARELKLLPVPPVIHMLLPKDREQKIADEELRYAEKSGRAPQQIQATWFDFRLRNGSYEPVVVRQQ